MADTNIELLYFIPQWFFPFPFRGDFVNCKEKWGTIIFQHQLSPKCTGKHVQYFITITVFQVVYWPGKSLWANLGQKVHFLNEFLLFLSKYNISKCKYQLEENFKSWLGQHWLASKAPLANALKMKNGKRGYLSKQVNEIFCFKN